MFPSQGVSHSDTFAVLVVTHKRLELLKILVQSLQQALLPVKSQYEVHFFINGDDDRHRVVVARLIMANENLND